MNLVPGLGIEPRTRGFSIPVFMECKGVSIRSHLNNIIQVTKCIQKLMLYQ